MKKLLALVAALSVGCATFIAETPQQKLYGSTVDLQTAIAATADYCALPWASLDKCEALLAAVQASDALILAVKAGLADGTLSGAQASDILRIVADLLEQLEKETPARPDGPPSPREVL